MPPARAKSILMICPQYRPIVGGYERAAERLSGELVRQGCDVAVLTEQRLPEWPRHEMQDGVAIHRWPCRFKPKIHMATSILGMIRFLVRHGRRFDIWHVHQYGMHCTFAVAMAMLLRRPVVLKLTNTGPQGLGVTLSTARLGALQRWAHRRISACVAVSAESAAEAVVFGIPQLRVVEIPNGIDVMRFAPASIEERARLRQALDLDPSRQVAVFVGRLSSEKNPLALLRAWALLRPRLTAPWTLVMVGDGPLRTDVALLISELGLNSDVWPVGQTKHVPQWLGAADLFVLSSLNEGMANTLLEAMACGLPSVVTDVSGMDQLVRRPQTGLVVPTDSPEALASALQSLHADPERRRQMGERARDLILQRYAIARVADEHRQLYGSILDRTARA